MTTIDPFEPAFLSGDGASLLDNAEVRQTYLGKRAAERTGPASPRPVESVATRSPIPYTSRSVADGSV